MKLNLGAGGRPLAGYLNVDIADLPGIQRVCDLSVIPYPFSSDWADEIQMINTLEHLPREKTVAVMEELHRIAKPGASVIIRVPYYNSWEYTADPTHQRAFNERTMNFFDPSTPDGKQRAYYSTAKFRVERVSYFFPLWRFSYEPKYWVRVDNKTVKTILHSVAHAIGGIIWVIEYQMRAMK